MIQKRPNVQFYFENNHSLIDTYRTHFSSRSEIIESTLLSVSNNMLFLVCHVIPLKMYTFNEQKNVSRNRYNVRTLNRLRLFSCKQQLVHSLQPQGYEHRLHFAVRLKQLVSNDNTLKSLDYYCFQASVNNVT